MEEFKTHQIHNSVNADETSLSCRFFEGCVNSMAPKFSCTQKITMFLVKYRCHKGRKLPLFEHLPYRDIVFIVLHTLIS